MVGVLPLVFAVDSGAIFVQIGPVAGHGCLRVENLSHVAIAGEFGRETPLEAAGQSTLLATGVHFLQDLADSLHDRLPLHADAAVWQHQGLLEDLPRLAGLGVRLHRARYGVGAIAAGGRGRRGGVGTTGLVFRVEQSA